MTTPAISTLTRRRFLETTARASTAAVVPLLIPGSALGRGGAVAPSEKVTLGGIGIRHGNLAMEAWYRNVRIKEL